VSPVRYKLDFYIPEGDILHSHRREDLKSYSPQCKANFWTADESRRLAAACYREFYISTACFRSVLCTSLYFHRSDVHG
jgi:hypothetical protein